MLPRDKDRRDPQRSRTVLGLLVLSAVTIITLDARHDAGDSPVDPLRSAVGSVMGPTEQAAADLLRPVTTLPDYLGDVHAVHEQNARLQRLNAELTTRLRSSAVGVARAAELAGISATAETDDFQVTYAQVVAIGPRQSFSRTVTIDAGTGDGVQPDLSVVNADGLVGRVIRATPTTATVLLIVDRDSTVGGRLSGSMELGFLTGDGDLSGDGRLELSLVDHTVSPRAGDTVVTWGSRGGAPYLPGLPIGTVTGVRESPSDLTQTASIRPFVDFSSLDVVGVITARHGGATSDLADGEER